MLNIENMVKSAFREQELDERYSIEDVIPDLEDHCVVLLEEMIGDHVKRFSDSRADRAQRDAVGSVTKHMENVRSSVGSETKMHKLTALYAAKHRPMTLMGWSRFCVAHKNIPDEEIDREYFGRGSAS